MEEEGEAGIDVPLFLATTCEEELFPWSRSASPRVRIAEARAQIQALPPSSIAPFTPANMFDFSDLPTCAHWPFATPAPPTVQGPLPSVPTLILSGADDLRTPTSGARALAAQIPGSHLLVVPDTGHAVLESAPTRCARNALRALFAGGASAVVKPCVAQPLSPLLRPTPLAPARLADVSPEHGYSGRDGRTLRAVGLTIGDFARQFVLQLLEVTGGSGGASGHATIGFALRLGGLRAGWAQLTKAGLRFHNYSYVPGVTLSGTIAATKIDLRVGGSAAAHGTLRLGAHRALIGTLGGRHVHIGRSPSATAAIVGANAQASPDLGPRGSAARARARELAGLLGGLPWPE
jgi:hypothetical protein